jgi:hypothetical protein
MHRKREQADLIFRLGCLFGPLLKVNEKPADYGETRRREIAAQFFAEQQQMLVQIGRFCTGKEGSNYLVQSTRASDAILSLSARATNSDEREAALFKSAPEILNRVVAEMLDVPVETEGTIHSPSTPFSVFCLVSDLCSTVKKEIVWIDRYFDDQIFYRYLKNVPPSAAITLVTYPKTMCKGAKDNSRYDSFMSVSKLFAVERGPSGYRLLVDEHFHDRWLRFDDSLFQLGGSIKDLGNGSPFTISKLDLSPQNIGEVDQSLARGIELFGPKSPNHG